MHAYGAVDPPVAATVGLPVHVFPAPVGTALYDGHLYLVWPDGFVAAEGVTAEPLVAALPRKP